MTKTTTTKSNTVKSTPAKTTKSTPVTTTPKSTIKKVVLTKQHVKNEISRRTFAVGTPERKAFGPQAIVDLLNAELAQVLATPGSVAKAITAMKDAKTTTLRVVKAA